MTTRIETQRLILRRGTPADADAVVSIWCDPVVMMFMHGPRDPDQVRTAFLDECANDAANVTMWVVEERSTSEVVGDCGLMRKTIEGVDELELIYLFGKGVWGQGYATEAAMAVRDHAFSALDAPRIVALIVPDHAASIRVAQKIGMHHEKDIERPSRLMRLYQIEAR